MEFHFLAENHKLNFQLVRVWFTHCKKSGGFKDSPKQITTRETRSKRRICRTWRHWHSQPTDTGAGKPIMTFISTTSAQSLIKSLVCLPGTSVKDDPSANTWGRLPLIPYLSSIPNRSQGRHFVAKTERDKSNFLCKNLFIERLLVAF